ncbi:hypothetical protein [Vibrio owensii]|uniref:hypothetical protein n=1 Tax=Vibrio owensii TaxID=696485 RepID=UPI003CC5333D
MDMQAWDNGNEVFDLLENSPFWKWDSRDSYSIPESRKLVSKLVELDPTKMVAVSYVSLLLNTAFTHTSVTLQNAVLNDEFIAYAHKLREHKDTLDDYSTPLMEAFIERVQSSCVKMTGARFVRQEEAKGTEPTARFKLISKDVMIRLLRDAVVATETPIHWIYSDGNPAKHQFESLSLHSDILLYPSISELNKDIREHSLAYGFRYVTVNAAKQGEKSLHFIVYTSASHAFIMSDIHWDKYNSRMAASGEGYHFHLHGLDYVQSHYPQLNANNSLAVQAEGRQVVGSINSCEDTSKVWLLMLTELMALKLPTISPTGDLISTRLLLDNKVNPSLPIVMDKPFEIEHVTLEEAIEKIGLNDSAIRETLLPYLDGITMDVLLPKGQNVFNTDLGEFVDDIPDSIKRVSSARSPYCVLMPYPFEHFGDKQSTRAAHDTVILSNLANIVNKRIEMRWRDQSEVHSDWFRKMLHKKSNQIKEKLPQLLSVECPVDTSIRLYDGGIFTGVSDGARYLALKAPKNWDHVGVSIAVPALTKSYGGELMGYFTEEFEFDRFLLLPSSTEEIMEIYSCRKSTLPELLQNWKRLKDHGAIKYPWNYRGQLSIAAGWVYY